MGRTSIKATARYRSKAYDQVSFVVPKGDRDRYKAFAVAQGESLAGLIKRLLDAEMERVKGADGTP